MPKALEEKLKRRAEKLHRQGKVKDVDAYVYGTLRKTGWKPKGEKRGLPKRSFNQTQGK